MQRLLTCWARGRAPASRALTQSRCLSSSELEGAPAGKTETVARHRPVMNLYEQRPKVGYAATFVAPNATVVGDVELVDKTSTVWYGAVLRGDKNSIKVGGHSSIGDNTSITTVSRLQNGFPARCTIGNWTIVEPGCSLTSCAIGNSCKVGAGSTISEGAVMEDNSTLLPGSLLTSGSLVPSMEIWGGSPAKKVGQIDSDHISDTANEAEKISDLAAEHLDEFNPHNMAFEEAEQLELSGRKV